MLIGVALAVVGGAAWVTSPPYSGDPQLVMPVVSLTPMPGLVRLPPVQVETARGGQAT